MIEPIISRSLPLRFVSLIGYETNPYTHDSRLLQDDGKSFDDIIMYCKKFDYSDNIRIQFITDYINDANNSVTLKLYNSLNVEVENVTVTATLLNDGIYVYNALINTTNLQGYYYCKINLAGRGKPTYTWQSDYFQVSDCEDYTYIEYRESDYDGINYYDSLITFGYRIEADLTKSRIETETETFELYNSIEVNARTKTKRSVSLLLDPIPSYVCESLDLAFSHKKVLVNGKEYVASGGAESENIEGTVFYTYSRQLTEVNYEVYENIIATGGVVDENTKYISTDGTKALSPDGIHYIKSF